MLSGRLLQGHLRVCDSLEQKALVEQADELKPMLERGCVLGKMLRWN